MGIVSSLQRKKEKEGSLESQSENGATNKRPSLRLLLAAVDVKLVEIETSKSVLLVVVVDCVVVEVVVVVVVVVGWGASTCEDCANFHGEAVIVVLMCVEKREYLHLMMTSLQKRPQQQHASVWVEREGFQVQKIIAPLCPPMVELASNIHSKAAHRTWAMQYREDERVDGQREDGQTKASRLATISNNRVVVRKSTIYPSK